MSQLGDLLRLLLRCRGQHARISVLVDVLAIYFTAATTIAGLIARTLTHAQRAAMKQTELQGLALAPAREEPGARATSLEVAGLRDQSTVLGQVHSVGLEVHDPPQQTG